MVTNVPALRSNRDQRTAGRLAASPPAAPEFAFLHPEPHTAQARRVSPPVPELLEADIRR